MYYALTFKDSVGFWCLGPVFEDRNIPANMMQVALDSGTLHRTDIAVICRNSVEALDETIDNMNKKLGLI